MLRTGRTLVRPLAATTLIAASLFGIGHTHPAPVIIASAEVRLDTTFLTLPGAFGAQSTMPTELDGMASTGTVEPVNYDNWTVFQAQVDQGAAMLNTQLLATPGPKVIFGYSLGALVANDWLNTYGPTSTIPASELTIVEVGDSERRYGGMLTPHGSLDSAIGMVSSAQDISSANSPYHVVDIAQQYDGWADAPNSPSSPYYLLAVVNALVGGNTLHPNYSTVNPNDPNNLIYQQANVSYVLVPTANLPILGPLATMFPALNAALKADIETAYNRPETQTAIQQGITAPLMATASSSASSSPSTGTQAPATASAPKATPNEAPTETPISAGPAIPAGPAQMKRPAPDPVSTAIKTPTTTKTTSNTPQPLSSPKFSVPKPAKVFTPTTTAHTTGRSASPGKVK